MDQRPQLYCLTEQSQSKLSVRVDDCACPNNRLSVVNDKVAGSDEGLFSFVHTERLEINQDYELFFQPLRPQNLTVLNDAARRILNAFWTPKTIHSLENEVDRLAAKAMVRLGLLQPLDHQPIPMIGKARDLSVWLQVTNQCNLDCAYCYVDKSSAEMSQATGLNAIERVFQSAIAHGFGQVTLKYAGGEPALRFERVLAFQNLSRHLATESGLELSATLLSNGTLLTPERLKALKGMEIGLMLSLDGPAAHDQQRPYRNGLGSYHQARVSVLQALQAGLRPNLSVTVTRWNVNDLASMAEFAAEHGLHLSLNLFRENEFNSCSASRLSAAPKQVIAGVKSVLNVLETHLADRRMIDGLLDTCAFSWAHDRSCGMGHNYVVIGPAGQVLPCQMKMQHSLGTIFEHDPVELIRSAEWQLQNRRVEERENCSACKWRYVCGGGCPLLAQRQAGSHANQSPNCEIYQALLPELLRLEGLRLLQYESIVL